jgi:uncharacterized protein YecT (DUF1311 family)
MKYFFLIVILVYGYYATGQTQWELNISAEKKSLQARKEMNSVYNAILRIHKTDTLFIKNLKIAQRLWMKLRDAEMLVRYPDREEGYYGSAHRTCLALYDEELTRERIKKLKNWFGELENGDGCSMIDHAN